MCSSDPRCPTLAATADVGYNALPMYVSLQELESRVTPLHAEYWGCLLTLAEHELEACSLLHEAETQGVRLDHQPGVRHVGAPLPTAGAAGGVHTAVQQQVELLLSGGRDRAR